MKIKVGIIGCGKIGLTNDYNKFKKKITYFSNLCKNRNYALVAATDLNSENLSLIKNKDRKIKLYNNYQLMLLNHKLDVIIVSSSTETHYQILKDISNYTIKLVIAEKPFLINKIQLKKIVNIYKKKKISISVNYSRKFNNSYNIIKKFLKKIILNNGIIIINRGFYNNASHYIDFLLELFGEISLVKNVKLLKSNILNYDFYGEFEIVLKNKINIFFKILDIKNLSYEKLIFFGKKNILEIRDDKVYIYNVIKNKKTLSTLKNNRIIKISYSDSISNHLYNVKNFLEKKTKLKSCINNAINVNKSLNLILDNNEK